MKESLVTIGLPVFNGGEHLDQTLAALVAQDFSDFTLLVSDNCSGDDTPEILARWQMADPRIQVVRQPSNIGAIANFAFVLNQAKSKWFMFAAHDDTWSPNYISALVAAATEHPTADLLVPEVVFSFQDEREWIHRGVDESMFALQGVKRVRALLGAAHGSWIYGLHRRERLADVFRATRGYRPVWGADLLMLLPYLLSGAVAGTNKAVFTHLETTLSRERYRPKTARDQWATHRDFLIHALRFLRTADMNAPAKLALLGGVMNYSNKHSFKIRRVLKSALAAPFKKTPKAFSTGH